MDNRKNKNKIKNTNKDDQGSKDTELVMFLAEQEDIRDERGEFEVNGTIFKTMVEVRPADEAWPRDTWDAYVVIDGHFYLTGSYDDSQEACRAIAAVRIRLEKSAKSFIANYLAQRDLEF